MLIGSLPNIFHAINKAALSLDIGRNRVRNYAD